MFKILKQFDVTTVRTFIALILPMGFIKWNEYRRQDVKFREEQANREQLAREKQIELELKKLELERERFEKDHEEREMDQYRMQIRENESEIRQSAGVGSGGFILMDMPDDHRPYFHDLLKGFEDYARLRGYSVLFSVDNSFEEKIAFKFTIQNEGFTVGQERVRSDFREHLEKIKDVDSIDELPVMVSMEEHNLLVTTLKNRISFLQHSYNLEKYAKTYLEGLLWSTRNMPVFPNQQILLQTGGIHDSRKYTVSHSNRLIQGDQNATEDHSVNFQHSNSTFFH